MGKRKYYAAIQQVRQRVAYWKKKKGIDLEAAIIIAVRPPYVVKEFKQVEKKHGRKHAVSWLKGKYRIRG